MSWILTRKADSLELDKHQREITRAKAKSARNRPLHLLAIEQNIEPNTKELTIAHSRAKRKAVVIIQADVKREQLRAIRKSKANDNSDEDNNMDEKEEEEGSE